MQMLAALPVSRDVGTPLAAASFRGTRRTVRNGFHFFFKNCLQKLKPKLITIPHTDAALKHTDAKAKEAQGNTKYC